MGREQISSLLDFARPSRALRQLNFLAKMTVLTIFMFEKVNANARPQGHRHFLARPPGIFSCAKALGLGTYFGAKAPGCPGGDGNRSK